jgi:hypothetical protein
MDQVVIRESIATISQNVTEQDKALGREFNALQWEALKIAHRYLKYGPEDCRLAVVKSVLSATARLSAVDTQSEIETHRTAFMRMLGGEEVESIEATSLLQQSDD